MAAKHGNIEEMQYVLDRGVDINAVTQTGVSALRASLNSNNKQVVQCLIGAAGIDLKAHWGTALEIAASGGHLEIVEMLIDAGSDINYQSFDAHPDYSYTPLHSAAWQGQFAVVQYLMEAGADTRLKNYYGERAVYLERENNKEIAELISKYEPADLHDYDLKVEELKRMKLPKGIIQDLGDERQKVELPNSKNVDYLIYCSVFEVTEVTFNGIRLLIC